MAPETSAGHGLHEGATAQHIITLPEVQECTPLMSTQALCIEPQNTVDITLLPMSGHNLPTCINGYMYAHPSLEEGLIMFEGVQTTGEGCVSAWLTNTTDFQVYVDAGEAIAFGKPTLTENSSLRTHSPARLSLW